MSDRGKFSGAIDQERLRPIVDQIGKRFGRVIDLDKSPFVMIEILREFGHVLDDDGGGGGGGGGGVSTIAVGITPPTSEEPVELADVMKAVLRVQRDLSDIKTRIDTISPGG
ncbi:MAG: hypothetical protein M3271_06960 [Actinomycetota bacterium]|nr:hypothetical protein [Actinomycetota bacterium]